MASYSFQTITAAQAAAYNAASDSLSFGSGSANQITAFYLPPDQVSILYGGQTVNFGAGIYGDQDLTFDSGAHLYLGGAGADTIVAGSASDALYGGAGADSLSGGDGADVLQGNQGADTLIGGAGNDSIYGGQDNDLIILGSASNETNWSNGNKGDDTITGSDGADTLLGGQDNDSIAGGAGGDFLDGNLGDDIVRGGVGDDTILGEGGYDQLTGGGGADMFVFGAGSSEVDAYLADRILDWSADDHIVLPIRGGYVEFVAPGQAPPPPGDPSEYSNYDYTLPEAVNYFSQGLGSADARMHAVGNHVTAELRILAAQAGRDVMVFVDVDGDNHTDLAIILVGTNLSLIGPGNFL